jgi:hypothetical protein
MNLCKYHDIFGKPREGVHSFRIFDLAVVDVVGTVIIAYVIHRRSKYSFPFVLILLLLTGHIMHRLFCVQTKLI